MVKKNPINSKFGINITKQLDYIFESELERELNRQSKKYSLKTWHTNYNV